MGKGVNWSAAARRRVARGQYEIASRSARELDAVVRAAWGDLPKHPRIPKADLREQAAALCAGVPVKRLPPMKRD